MARMQTTLENRGPPSAAAAARKAARAATEEEEENNRKFLNLAVSNLQSKAGALERRGLLPKRCPRPSPTGQPREETIGGVSAERNTPEEEEAAAPRVRGSAKKEKKKRRRARLRGEDVPTQQVIKLVEAQKAEVAATRRWILAMPVPKIAVTKLIGYQHKHRIALESSSGARIKFSRANDQCEFLEEFGPEMASIRMRGSMLAIRICAQMVDLQLGTWGFPVPRDEVRNAQKAERAENRRQQVITMAAKGVMYTKDSRRPVAIDPRYKLVRFDSLGHVAFEPVDDTINVAENPPRCVTDLETMHEMGLMNYVQHGEGLEKLSFLRGHRLKDNAEAKKRDEETGVVRPTVVEREDTSQQISVGTMVGILIMGWSDQNESILPGWCRCVLIPGRPWSSVVRARTEQELRLVAGTYWRVETALSDSLIGLLLWGSD